MSLDSVTHVLGQIVTHVLRLDPFIAQVEMRAERRHAGLGRLKKSVSPERTAL
jgi:hypothetical protein